MGDKDDPLAPAFQVTEYVEQDADFVSREGSGRLVEDDQLGFLGKHLADLHHLPQSHWQRSNQSVRIDLDADSPEDGSAERPGFIPIQQSTRIAWPCAHDDVLGNSQLGKQRELLVDDANPSFPRVGIAPKSAFDAVQEDFPGISGVDAGQNLHESAFSGSILSDQAMNFPA